MYFSCPETRGLSGLSLEEIDLVFVSKGLKEADAAQMLVRGADTSSSIMETVQSSRQHMMRFRLIWRCSGGTIALLWAIRNTGRYPVIEISPRCSQR